MRPDPGPCPSPDPGPGPDPNPVPRQSRWERVITIFKAWDEDGNGCIDRAEFLNGLGVLGIRTRKSDIDAFFETFDPDESARGARAKGLRWGQPCLVGPLGAAGPDGAAEARH